MSLRNIVVIGTSAGGLETLKQLLAGIPETTAATMFVVQHRARQSPLCLDRILNDTSSLPVSESNDGDVFQMGHIYLAPPDRHLLLSDGRTILTRGPRENRSRPAIDPLFRSAAVAYGPRVIGVILSGMLDDGTAGLSAVKRCGGVAVVQDPDDALFSEMPQNAIDYVDVDHIERLQDLPQLLLRLVGEESGPAITIPRDLVLETRMAEAESGDTRRTEEIGRLTAYACPSCNGPLWQLDSDAIERYRCHTGHAFTARTLAEELTEASERALWIALQTMEERSRMLLRIANQQRQRGHIRLSQRFSEQAQELEGPLHNLRWLLMNQPDLAKPTEHRIETET